MSKRLEALSEKVKCSLHLDFNPHKDVYETAQNYYSSEDTVGVDLSQDIWVLQIYPITPIGFYRITANSLDEVLDEAERVAAAW